MILILGGAYQGKRQFARENLGVSPEDMETLGENTILDFSKTCYAGIEELVLTLQKEKQEPVQWFREHRQALEDKIFICQDMFCGVVPMGAEMRAWRQNTGLVCQYLAEEANTVWRVYCGLGQRLK